MCFYGPSYLLLGIGMHLLLQRTMPEINVKRKNRDGHPVPGAGGSAVLVMTADFQLPKCLILQQR